MKKPPPSSSYSEECNKRPTERRHFDPEIPPYAKIDKIRKGKRAVVDFEVPESIREKAREASEDLMNKREAFLKARLRPIWQVPGMTEIAAKFVTLQIQRTVESKDNILTVSENLKIICDPPRYEKLFLK